MTESGFNTVRPTRHTDRRQSHWQFRARIAQPFRLPQQCVRKEAVEPLQVLRQWFDVRSFVGESEGFKQQPSNGGDGKEKAVGVSLSQDLEACEFQLLPQFIEVIPPLGSERTVVAALHPTVSGASHER